MLVKGECNQFKEYAYLSIQNWKSFKNQTKSADEAQQYSQQLVREIITDYLSIYISTWYWNHSTTEEYIKQTTLGRQIKMK